MGVVDDVLGRLHLKEPVGQWANLEPNGFDQAHERGRGRGLVEPAVEVFVGTQISRGVASLQTFGHGVIEFAQRGDTRLVDAVRAALSGLTFQEQAHLQDVVELRGRELGHGHAAVRYIDQRTFGRQAL